MKKVVIILTACIMSLLFTVKTPVYAAEYYGDFQYEESEDSVAVYSYNGAEKEVSIPAYINCLLLCRYWSLHLMLLGCLGYLKNFQQILYMQNEK